jgi:transposase
MPKSDFLPLDGDFHGTTAHREFKDVYGKEFTVVVTSNPVLYEAQMVGVLANIASCGKALTELQERLRLRKEGVITKGKKPTAESVSKNIQTILSPEYMRDIFDYTIADAPGQTPELTFSFSDERFAALQERVLGKTILFTDRNEWTNEQIVSAYRSQYHVEEAFKQMKDTSHLSFRPLRHFTDAKIRVHAFYCVLAYTLAALLNKELMQMGHDVSINRMLDKFQEAQQVVSVFNTANGKKPVIKTAYSRFEGIAREYDEKFGLLRYLN